MNVRGGGAPGGEQDGQASAERTNKIEGVRRKTLEIFEIFVPEIGENAPNFEN